MGSCFSSSTETLEPLSKPKPVASTTTAPRYPAPPSDPPLPDPDAEEETVKEVLSETPRPPRPKSTPLPTTTRTRADQVADLKGIDIIDKAIPLPVIVPLATECSNGCDARSEDASEAWSISAKNEVLSASATTTPPAEKRRATAAETGRRTPREERSPAKYQRKRSVSGEFACRRNRSVAVSYGSGRSSPSPAARKLEHAAVGRTNSAREAARSRATGAGATRDSGEGSGSRWESPAAELLQSGGQCGAKGLKQQIPADEGGRGLCMQGKGTAGCEGEGKESLENPLVSLECFIFL